MKKRILLAFIYLLPVQFVLAQPTQAEINKMMQDAQQVTKKYGGDSITKKAINDAMKGQSATNTQSSSYEASSYSNVDNWKFPVRNTALLSLLPKRILSKPGLISLLDDLYNQLSKKLPPAVKSSVESVFTKYKNDGTKMGEIAVKGWYTDYRDEALLLIVKAAMTNPDNGLLLNNCAALLNMSGIEQKAIPVLKYVLQSYPGNSMLLNNLGQAYAGLGETDTAMLYLGRSIKADPANVEATNTAGQIEAAKGNKQKAIDYFEQSLKAAYTKPAQLKLRKIKKDSKLPPLARPRIKIPEYFNLFKYDVPAQCINTSQAATADAEYNAFRQMITLQGQAYGAKLGVLMQQQYKTAIQGATGRKVRKDEFMAQPYQEFCGIMYRDIDDEYKEAVKQLSRVTDKNYTTAMTALETSYQKESDILEKGFEERGKRCCGEGKDLSCCPSAAEKCKAYNELANRYLPQFAALTEDWQRKNLVVYQTYFDELIYWSYLTLHPQGDDVFRLQSFYLYIENYLSMLAKISYTRIIHPCTATTQQSTINSNEVKEIECPLEIEIPFIVGKFELNCETFSFSGGEGAVFSYQKDFKTGQSTVSIGAGLKLELGTKLGPVETKASAGMSETLFICFDGNNKFSDGGLKFTAKASVGAEAEVGQKVKGKKDMKEETSLGYTVGINSGWNFQEGALKGKIGPGPETQINKNIPIYKPK